MLLASKAAWAGIVCILLTTGFRHHAGLRSLRGPTSAKKCLERDLPELLSFFAFPRYLWRKLRTANVFDAARGSAPQNPAHGLL